MAKTIITLLTLLLVCNNIYNINASPVDSSNTAIVKVENKKECKACELIYGAIVTAVKFQNASVAELEKISKEICDMHILNFTAPKAVKQVCGYVLKDITKVRIAIVDGISSDQFCKNAKFCDATNGVVLSTSDDTTKECKVCKLIYGAIVTAVKFQNASVAELEKISKEICDMHILNFTAPKAVKQVCGYVLKDITKVRIAIVDGISSDQFCKNAKFCDATDDLMAMSVDVTNKRECEACKLIFGAVVATVKLQNDTVAELEKISKEVCDMNILNFTAPKAVKQVCHYVLKDITKVRVAIVDGITSDKFCVNAKFCDTAISGNLRGR